MVIVVEVGVNAAFPVPLLHPHYFTDQGSFVGLTGLVARLVAGPIQRAFWLTHSRTLHAALVTDAI
jgi:hypothetical protein